VSLLARAACVEGVVFSIALASKMLPHSTHFVTLTLLPTSKNNSTHANSEGTKKQGISPKRKAKLLAKARESAAKKAAGPGQ
jgi:hypothetical protein